MGRSYVDRYSLWRPYENGGTIGEQGSERTILVAEEHVEGARVQLEEGSKTAPFAITCGVYNWLVHTRYFSTRQVADDALVEMKRGLEDVLQVYHDVSQGHATQRDISRAIEEFVKRFP